jgi:hypothetical protein
MKRIGVWHEGGPRFPHPRIDAKQSSATINNPTEGGRQIAPHQYRKVTCHRDGGWPFLHFQVRPGGPSDCKSASERISASGMGSLGPRGSALRFSQTAVRFAAFVPATSVLRRSPTCHTPSGRSRVRAVMLPLMDRIGGYAKTRPEPLLRLRRARNLTVRWDQKFLPARWRSTFVGSLMVAVVVIVTSSSAETERPVDAMSLASRL